VLDPAAGERSLETRRCRSWRLQDRELVGAEGSARVVGWIDRETAERR